MDELEFIEKYLGIELLSYQKILLKAMLAKDHICCPRGHTKFGREIAYLQLNELRKDRKHDPED